MKFSLTITNESSQEELSKAYAILGSLVTGAKKEEMVDVEVVATSNDNGFSGIYSEAIEVPPPAMHELAERAMVALGMRVDPGMASAKFLDALARKGRLTTKDCMELLNLKRGSGIGGMLGTLNTIATDRGFLPPYTVVREQASRGGQKVKYYEFRPYVRVDGASPKGANGRP